MYINKPCETSILVSPDSPMAEITFYWGKRMIVKVYTKATLQADGYDHVYPLLERYMDAFLKNCLGHDPGGQGEWVEASEKLVCHMHMSHFFIDGNHNIKRVENRAEACACIEGYMGKLKINFSITRTECNQ